MSIGMKHALVGAATVMAAVIAFQPAASHAADSYYKGKTVRFIVGFGAGGGYDTYARMIAPFLKRYIPGSNVVINNVTGAGGLRRTNPILSDSTCFKTS